MDLVKFEGWDLDTTGDEPRVRDIAIGEHGGLARPRDIRRLIETHWDELAAHGEIRVCAQSARNKQGRVSAAKRVA